MAMARSVEQSVREFYDERGWKGSEDRLFRQYSQAYQQYRAAAAARTIDCFAGRSGSLLIAGGGDMPESHIDIATKFDKTACIDISQTALDIAQRKVPKLERTLGSICAAPFDDSTFDAVFCAHVIYHIDATEQEQAVRELIRICKPGGRVVIVYKNPRSPIRYAAGAIHRLRKLAAPKGAVEEAAGLYFWAHSLAWWNRFKDTSVVTMRPWDIIGSFEERTLIPVNGLASTFYGIARSIEVKSPRLAVKLWQYPIVILDKAL
jgi:SAM-dependent methyltransferase